jgi:hypothetical protein
MFKIRVNRDINRDEGQLGENGNAGMLASTPVGFNPMR